MKIKEMRRKIQAHPTKFAFRRESGNATITVFNDFVTIDGFLNDGDCRWLRDKLLTLFPKNKRTH